MSKECLKVATTLKDENTQPLKMRNVIIASFVTSYAQLKLFKVLEKMGSRLLCYDTDSVIYFCKQGETKLPLGSYLGELTNKLAKDEWIIRFCLTGSKCYSFQTN